MAKNKLPKKMFELNKMVTDKVTGIKGMLTHVQFYGDGIVHYIFQPGALNPETGAPVTRHWLIPGRIEGGVKVSVPKIPVKAFGTEAKDKCTGFKGKVISFIIHPDGCLHVELQPEGVVVKTGSKREAVEFDIRRLEGEALTPLSEEEYKKSIKERPSPAGFATFSPSSMDSPDTITKL